MSEGNNQLAEAVREAVQDGDIASPTQLIASIVGIENPLQALQHMDQAQDLFAEFDKDFGFIRFSFITRPPSQNPPIQTVDRVRYASLLRWLVGELRQWRHAEDLRFEKLVAALVAAQV